MTTKVQLDEDEVPTATTLLTLGAGEHAISVPPIGMGLWSWGDQRWAQGTAMDDQSIRAAFDATMSLGVNLFDTAEVYGNGESERFLGRFVKATAGAQKIIVATKFLPRPLYVGWWGYPDVLINHLKLSMERLQVAKVDLYQIHGPIHLFTYIETIADALAKAVKDGLCTTVGVSNYSVAEMQRMHAALAKHGIQLASNQVEFSLLHRLPEVSGLMAEAKKLGVAILAYSPLAMGRLTGKYDVNNPPPSNRWFGSVNMQDVQPVITKLRELGQKYDKSPAQIALNWIICKGAIPIPGAKNAKQAQENAAALNFRLTKDEVAELEKLGHIGTTSMWQHG